MEEYEIINEFIKSNKIDVKLFPYIIELLEVYRSILFLGKENINIKEIQSIDILEEKQNLRMSFIKSELSKLNDIVSKLNSLKELNDPDSYVLIDEVIKDKQVFINRLSKEIENPSSVNLEDIQENNKKDILNTYKRLKTIDENIINMINKPELIEYYESLKEQMDILKLDDSKEKDNSVNLDEEVKPSKIDKGIFYYGTEQFDEVKIIKIEDNKKHVRYRSGEKHSYSIIEDRDVLNRELDYWNKKINNGFDRYDSMFYDDVIDTFNFIKFYYKFRCFVMYSEVNNKKYSFEDSKLEIEKDKNQLETLSNHINQRMGLHKIKGLELWKEERNPGEYFSNHKDKTIILEALLPKDGIGRSISSPEMLKSIYGESFVIEMINTFEKGRGIK